MINKIKLLLTMFFLITQSTLSQTNFWQTTNGPQSHVYSLLLHSNGTVIAGCDRIVFYSTDNGGQWIQSEEAPDTRIISITETPNGDIFGGTINGFVYRSTDSGKMWTKANPGWPAAGVFGITSNSLGTVFATNTNIFITTNSGISWTHSALPSPNLPLIYSIVIDNSDNIYAGTYDYGIFKSQDNGNSWISCGGDFSGIQIRTLTFDSIGGFWASGSDSLFFSTDMGVTWENRSENLPEKSIGSIIINSNNHLFVATNDGGIFRSKNYGKTWSPINSGLTSLSTNSLILEPTGFIQVGTDSGVFRSLQSTTLFSSPKDNLVFNDVAVGQSLVDSLLVINNGTELLEITSIITNTSDYSISPQSATLSVNQRMWFHVIFKPKYFGLVKDTIKFVSNANTSPDEASLTGTGKASCLQCPKNFNIGKVLVNKVKDSLITFTNIGNDTLKIRDITINDAHFSFTNTTLQIPPNQYFNDTIKFAPNISSEIITEAIISSNSIFSPDTIEITGVADTILTAGTTEKKDLNNYRLFQNYPNPFNPITVIDYYIPQESYVTLKIYDLTGREVKTIFAEDKAAGNYSIKWDGTDNRNNKLSSSVYFLTLSSKGNTIIRKMVLLK